MTVPAPELTGLGPPPPFDPEVAFELRRQADEVVVDLQPEDIPALRRRVAQQAVPTDEQLALRGDFVITEHRAPARDSHPAVRLLACLPTGQLHPTPVLYWIHGGGMIVGSYRDDLHAVLDLARSIAAAVVSVEYRLAPEHRYPAQVEDCYTGLLWTTRSASLLNIDPAKVVVAGISAGGGLAAATALLVRDRQELTLAGQLLLCPMLDDRNDSYSAVQMAGTGSWDRTANATGWTALLGERAGEDVPSYAAPARARDLSNLAPAYIDVGSSETFRDENIAYADAIWRAGGQAELHVFAGGAHGFDGLAPAARITADAKDARMRWLRRQFRRHAGWTVREH